MQYLHALNYRILTFIYFIRDNIYFFSTAILAISLSSSSVYTIPVGLLGLFIIIAFVFSVIAPKNLSIEGLNPLLQ